MKNKLLAASLAILAMATFPAKAEGPDTFSRGSGVTARIGAGAPANFNLGLGYQFGPHLSLTGEAFSYSGLTTMTGTVDARYYVYDRCFTPFLEVRAGYGVLGTTYENKKYCDALGSMSAGLSWRRFDLGAGVIFDSFHKAEFTAGISWTVKIGR